MSGSKLRLVKWLSLIAMSQLERNQTQNAGELIDIGYYNNAATATTTPLLLLAFCSAATYYYHRNVVITTITAIDQHFKTVFSWPSTNKKYPYHFLEMHNPTTFLKPCKLIREII